MMVIAVSGSFEHQQKFFVYRVAKMITRVSVRLEFRIVQGPVKSLVGCPGVILG
jgi:hypothetical protein